MIWEYLRSCYSFTMRVYIDGVPTLVPARWYWAAPGAKHWDGPHGNIASPWWENNAVNQDWGEVTPWPQDPNAAAPRGLDRGLNPGYPGQCYVGDPQWFVDGQLPASILRDPPDPFPACCRPSPATASGGVILDRFPLDVAGCQEQLATPAIDALDGTGAHPMQLEHSPQRDFWFVPPLRFIGLNAAAWSPGGNCGPRHAPCIVAGTAAFSVQLNDWIFTPGAMIVHLANGWALWQLPVLGEVALLS